ncbi:hypothetical protein V5E38_01410 [Rossellomorea sp. GAMAL-10_SWC]
MNLKEIGKHTATSLVSYYQLQRMHSTDYLPQVKTLMMENPYPDLTGEERFAFATTMLNEHIQHGVPGSTFLSIFVSKTFNV